MTGLRFYVPGVPSTQGSKKAYVRATKAGPRAVMTDDPGEALASWRETVRSEARTAAGPAWERLEGPVEATLVFGLPAPKSLPKRRRSWPVGARSGDVDKLTRAVFDSLTQALIWRDDSVVVRLHVTKDYAGTGVRQGVEIALRMLTDPAAPDPVRSTADVRTPAGGLTLAGDPLMIPDLERHPT